MHKILLSLTVGLALSATASAQNAWYFDFGDPISVAGTPSNMYAAAAPLAGTWNAIDTLSLTAGSFPATLGSLVNIAGSPSTTMLEIDEQGTGLFNLTFDNLNTFGDDQALMDDITYFGTSGTIKLTGVPAGTYDVYTYGMAPDSGTFRTGVDVTGSTGGLQAVGGSFINGHQLLESYALHTITVASGGDIEVVFSISQSFISINGLQIIEQGAGSGVGTNYCGPAVANSSGSPAIINASGSALVVDNDLTLSGSGLPNNQFAIFVNSLSQGFVPMPGGSLGNLCLSGGLGRYNGPGQILNSGAGGSVSLLIDLNATPTPAGPVSIFPGETWNFQLWYRDLMPGPVSNFSDGVSVTFM